MNPQNRWRGAGSAGAPCSRDVPAAGFDLAGRAGVDQMLTALRAV